MSPVVHTGGTSRSNSEFAIVTPDVTGAIARHHPPLRPIANGIIQAAAACATLLAAPAAELRPHTGHRHSGGHPSPMTQKQIWIPKSETNVTVDGHDVRVIETMTMLLKPITKPAPGFIDKRSF